MEETQTKQFWIDPAQLLAISKLRRRSVKSSEASSQPTIVQPEASQPNLNSLNENEKCERNSEAVTADRVDIAANRLKRLRSEEAPAVARDDDAAAKKRRVSSVSLGPSRSVKEATVSRFESVIDRSLKSYIRIVTNLPNFSIASSGYERAAALSNYTRPSGSTTANEALSLPVKLVSSLYSWKWPAGTTDEHSSLFRCEKLDTALHTLSNASVNRQDSATPSSAKPSGSGDEFSEFCEALTSLYSLFQHDFCSEFYILAAAFVVHFGTVEIETSIGTVKRCKFAVVSPSTSGLRDALRKYRVDFRAAYESAKANRESSSVDPAECDGTGTGAGTGVVDDAETNAFLQQLNVDLTQFPALRRSISRSNSTNGSRGVADTDVDGKLESALLITGDTAVGGLFRFLTAPANQRYFSKHAQRSATFAAILLSDTPFLRASLCQLSCSLHTAAEADGESRTTIEISGEPILPSNVARLVNVIKHATDTGGASPTAAFTMHLRTDSRSVAFNLAWQHKDDCSKEQVPLFSVATTCSDAERSGVLPACVSTITYRQDSVKFSLR